MTVWWLLKLLARAATRVRRALGLEEPGTHPTDWLMGASLDTGEPRPRANLADWLKGQPGDVVRDVRELAGVYATTFCGECEAGPERPELRCARCLERLVRVIDERNGGEVRKMAELAELARTGRL
jgi:hypothetical protein